MRLEDIPAQGATSRSISSSYHPHDERFLVIRAECPRRRDIWAILRGRYEPRVNAYWRLTAKGVDKMLKKHYVEPLREALYQPPKPRWPEQGA